MNRIASYEAHRPLLLALAYRMLGARSDAEDVVQDVFLTYHQIERNDIANEKAYLARMVTNRCLNLAGSARKRRETYVGNWLPEPVVEYGLSAAGDPAAKVEKRERITYAMLVVLERLRPVERAVFLLRETLGFDYGDIAQIVGKSEAACRKMISRALQKLGHAPDVPPFRSDRAAELAQAFIRAAETGDTAALIGMLTEDAVLVSDGGGKVRAAIFPILGRERILAFYAGLARKHASGHIYVPAEVSGQTGLLLLEQGRPTRVVTFQWDSKGERIERIYLVMNPDKLMHVLHRQLP